MPAQTVRAKPDPEMVELHKISQFMTTI